MNQDCPASAIALPSSTYPGRSGHGGSAPGPQSEASGPARGLGQPISKINKKFLGLGSRRDASTIALLTRRSTSLSSRS